MNWYVTRHIGALSEEKKEALFTSSCFGGCCEHCELDHGKATVVTYECDSFGRESYVMCSECWEAAQEEDKELIVFCRDCKQKVKKKDTVQWRPYDFDPRQGDEELTVCTSCVGKPTHRRRVEKDQQMLDEELELYGNRRIYG